MTPLRIKSPKAQALAVRIYGYAAPREWNVTVNDIADALGESPQRVGAIIQHAGWSSRLRVSFAMTARMGGNSVGFGHAHTPTRLGLDDASAVLGFAPQHGGEE